MTLDDFTWDDLQDFSSENNIENKKYHELSQYPGKDSPGKCPGSILHLVEFTGHFSE